MAQLEDLINDNADLSLHKQIAGEVSKLKARKTFGLVFEEHLPEVVQLPGLAIRPGTRVAKRNDKALAYFLVMSVVDGKKVSIMPERGGAEEIAAKDDLVVVKRFGEPMYPALVPADRLTRAPGKPYHTIINAENFYALQEECGKQIDNVFEQYRDKIDQMPSSRREQYGRIVRQGADPRAENIHPPESIEIRKETPLWDNHLFVNDSDKFGWKVNTWEETFLREEAKGKTFAGWLRNIPKKPWALCVPYGQGQATPLYPDMLMFRREANRIKIDILDPHDDTRADAAEKAVGLADFARKHGTAFSRIEMICIVKGQIQRLRLHQESVRDKVLKVKDLKHLAELYAQHG